MRPKLQCDKIGRPEWQGNGRDGLSISHKRRSSTNEEKPDNVAEAAEWHACKTSLTRTWMRRVKH
mgnify:CR=1 FL=1